VLIDPNEFMVAQDRMFASVNNVNTDLVYLSAGIVVLVTLYFLRFYKYLDVLALGKDQAINLGVPYDKVVKHLLVIVAVLISIATALIGPITFLGLLVVNVAYEFLKTYRHFYLIFGSVFISIIALLGGQFIVEKVFTFQTTLSVIINFIGGVYFIYLLLTYNQQPVIEDVSVSIEKGTITSFIGPNGAGKSTLISMISRLIARDDGEITIDGEDILKKKNNELAKKISILKQSNAIHLKLTV